jgi:hypothetical protein
MLMRMSYNTLGPPKITPEMRGISHDRTQRRRKEREILESSPRGTWILLLIFGILFTLAWLFIYFGVFLERGPVN